MNQPADGLPRRSLWWAAAAIWTGMALTVLDGPVISFVLSAISEDIGAPPAQCVWAITAYQIAIIAALFPFSALGEVIGYRRVYLWGFALFAGASLGCMASSGITSLTIMRFVQGLGAGAIMSVNGALVRHVWPRAMLGRAFGYNAAVIALSAACAPALAAILLELGSWRWIFAMNLPLGAAAIFVGGLVLPAARGAQRKLDLSEIGLCAACFAALFLGLSGLVHRTDPLAALALLGAGLIAGLFLIDRSRKDANPLLPLDLIRLPILRRAYLVAFLAFAVQFIALIALPLFIAQKLGSDHTVAAAVMTAWPAGVIVAGLATGRVMAWRADVSLVGAGLAILAAGLLALALLPSSGQFGLALLCCLCGIGFGLFQAPNSRTMIAGAPLERSGAAAGMLAMSRLVGQAFGGLMAAWFLMEDKSQTLPLLFAAALAFFALAISRRRAVEVSEIVEAPR